VVAVSFTGSTTKRAHGWSKEQDECDGTTRNAL
jgi:hypothetical protein